MTHAGGCAGPTLMRRRDRKCNNSCVEIAARCRVLLAVQARPTRLATAIDSRSPVASLCVARDVAIVALDTACVCFKVSVSAVFCLDILQLYSIELLFVWHSVYFVQL